MGQLTDHVPTASVYVATGDFCRAFDLLSRALAIKRSTLGSDAVELVDTLKQLAEVNVKQVRRCLRMGGEVRLHHIIAGQP